MNLALVSNVKEMSCFYGYRATTKDVALPGYVYISK